MRMKVGVPNLPTTLRIHRFSRRPHHPAPPLFCLLLITRAPCCCCCFFSCGRGVDRLDEVGSRQSSAAFHIRTRYLTLGQQISQSNLVVSCASAVIIGAIIVHLQVVSVHPALVGRGVQVDIVEKGVAIPP
jgi:hypothetical protein